MRNGKTVPFFVLSFGQKYCFLCKYFLLYEKKRIAENRDIQREVSKNAANAAFYDWSITTKPMHTALFSKSNRTILFLDRPLPW